MSALQVKSGTGKKIVADLIAASASQRATAPELWLLRKSAREYQPAAGGCSADLRRIDRRQDPFRGRENRVRSRGQCREGRLGAIAPFDPGSPLHNQISHWPPFGRLPGKVDIHSDNF